MQGLWADVSIIVSLYTVCGETLIIYIAWLGVLLQEGSLYRGSIGFCVGCLKVKVSKILSTALS